MSIITKAERRLAQIEAEAAELRTFLASAKRIEAMFGDATTTTESTRQQSPKSAKRDRGDRPAPQSGVVHDTVMAVIHYMQANGEGQRTRDLLEVVKAKGVSIGGTNEVGTLSARLSISKMFVVQGGKWFIKRASAGEESTDSRSKVMSADSLFTSNEGGHNGAPIV